MSSPCTGRSSANRARPRAESSTRLSEVAHQARPICYKDHNPHLRLERDSQVKSLLETQEEPGIGGRLGAAVSVDIPLRPMQD